MSVFLRIFVLKSSGGGFCRPCVGRRSVERRVVRVRESGRATLLCVVLLLLERMAPVLDVDTHLLCITCVFGVVSSRELASSYCKSSCRASNRL